MLDLYIDRVRVNLLYLSHKNTKIYYCLYLLIIFIEFLRANHANILNHSSTYIRRKIRRLKFPHKKSYRIF